MKKPGTSRFFVNASPSHGAITLDSIKDLYEWLGKTIRAGVDTIKISVGPRTRTLPDHMKKGGRSKYG